ncbi:serine hydrolase [Actinobacteria bacterium YIM 96077]|uniref:Serine hydrolase n=1 Tax=Phytoactinopolyspora halophila TaxID=1981511 RepID=A0A329QFQ1_9ACTN|nr:serine hydrolase [Phytoactinopolyspora halophila]AYY13633.1 serine hydrolase [Actinobacteria bacterium YIM 96077]RAW11197.1 serine hydrolase [Phytoactinopolyspora halophila]
MTTRWPAQNVAALQRDIGTLATSAPGRWGFAIREQGRAVASINGATAMPAASTIKVALLIMALQEVAAGRCELDRSLPVPERRVGGTGVLRLMPSVGALRLDETLELMIGVSDNTASNMVLDMLGLDDVTGRINALGARNTRLERHMMDFEASRSGRDNTTTADDQALLLDLLTGPDLLPDHLRQLALDILGRQQFNDRIPAGLGPDVGCRHKTGELAGVRHDVGILDFDGRSVAFAALGSELRDPVSQSTGTGPAADVIARAARAVVDAARL